MSLEELKKEIDAVGGQIAAAKKEITDKEEVKKVIGPLIPKLLELKKKYAEANNGIGVDGKPFGANNENKWWFYCKYFCFWC